MDQRDERTDRPRGGAAYIWAVGGVAVTLAVAVVRLADRGIGTIAVGLGPLEWVALAVLTAAFVYGEGVIAIGRRWVPWVLDRAASLREPSRPLARLLAPLHAMGLVGGPPGLLLRAWAGVAAIVAAVLVVRALPQPWRGIVDFAVASALAWGLAILLVRALTLRQHSTSTNEIT